MSILLERRKGFNAYNRNIRLGRLLKLYEAGLSVVDIAKGEAVSRSRIYQLLNEALTARTRGEI
tara:strand:+ start:463 stop:654 length:192 start_codon:yes stop_codon:yes gene_type:complete